MFDFGSTEAKRKLVSSWLHGNKFFMNALVAGFDEEEYSRIMLEVNENNNPAIRLYNKLGFKEISLRERYYGEDTALIMEKVR